MTVHRFSWLAAMMIAVTASSAALCDESAHVSLDWRRLPDLPNALGVAGPFSGVHNDALIVAGGANFPRPVWENDKAWHDEIYVLTKTAKGHTWIDGGKLPRPIAYGAAVSTSEGIVCMGGNDGAKTFRHVFLLRWNAAARKIEITAYPPLPRPCAYGQAALVGSVIYLAGGQSAAALDSAMKNFWSLDLSKQDDPRAFVWQEHTPWRGPPRALNLTVSQHRGGKQRVYVISGRRQRESKLEFLKDVWEYTPATDVWRQRADAPVCVMAGIGIGYGKSEIFVLGGADGSLFAQADQLKDKHPGFPKQAWVYDTLRNRWNSAGKTPQNHVTTIPVLWDDRIIIPSGEIRPRVRSAAVWSVIPVK